ncbi:Polyketide cyclase / dehydrase and lipid transport [Nocardioides terrae]|uniref:Polyketide cyclase / dehydrase and lipid transport n=1 Tax=Nocardioides terrae TaxID=574651 RepID=A0A1I1MZV3_9ACTN|nr:SRPBCC family protein [Nocardioides terrae]SFC90705.1 Polyketide cyclase / dehydrase and lipid transport [Nocardioides terrae]
MTTTAAASATGSDLEATITVAASPAQVWALVTDVARMPEWSPQVVRSVVLGGRVKLGARFVNVNRQGPKRWPTTAKVVRFTPHSDFAFRIFENHTIWSFQLEPAVDGGTVVTHRRETPDGISLASRVLTKIALGGQEPFTAELLDGMSRTLERIEAELDD